MISVKAIRAGNGGGVARSYAADVVDDRAILIHQPSDELAARLGITDTRTLTIDQIGALLDGRRTDYEEISGKYYFVARAEPDDSKRKPGHAIGALDACFSASKSVSLEWSTADPERRALIRQAHDEAVWEAAERLQEIVGQIKLGHAGSAGRESGETVALFFTHGESRPVDGRRDVQLHTHCLIPNVVLASRIGSLHTYQAHGRLRELGDFYQVELFRQLERRGIEVENRRGYTVIPSWTREQELAHSRRTLQAEQALDRGDYRSMKTALAALRAVKDWSRPMPVLDAERALILQLRETMQRARELNEKAQRLTPAMALAAVSRARTYNRGGGRELEWDRDRGDDDFRGPRLTL